MLRCFTSGLIRVTLLTAAVAVWCPAARPDEPATRPTAQARAEAHNAAIRELQADYQRRMAELRKSYLEALVEGVAAALKANEFQEVLRLNSEIQRVLPEVAASAALRPPPPQVSQLASPASLKVVNIAVESPAVGQPLRGRFAIRNTGPAYSTPANVVSPSWGVFVYDAGGKLLFRNFGSWGPGLKEGQEIEFRWDTRRNHLGETSEGPFTVSEPGDYVVVVNAYAAGRQRKIIDTSTSRFEVLSTGDRQGAGPQGDRPPTPVRPQ